MGKHFKQNEPAQSQKVGLEKDIDWHHQRLWKRKKYQQQIQKQETKKTFREYKKIKQELTVNDEAVDYKQKEFYRNLFNPEVEHDKNDLQDKDQKSAIKDPVTEVQEVIRKRGPKQGKNSKSGFNMKLGRIKQKREEEEQNKLQARVDFEKKMKQKTRYSKQLNRRNHKGQMVMSGMIAHYLNKIQK